MATGFSSPSRLLTFMQGHQNQSVWSGHGLTTFGTSKWRYNYLPRGHKLISCYQSAIICVLFIDVPFVKILYFLLQSLPVLQTKLAVPVSGKTTALHCQTETMNRGASKKQIANSRNANASVIFGVVIYCYIKLQQHINRSKYSGAIIIYLRCKWRNDLLASLIISC